MTNWDTIVASDGPLVWRTLWRLLADRADVEECFQETFVAALNLSRRERVGSWPAVLCHLATARAIDRLRARYRENGRRGGAEAVAVPLLESAVSSEASPEQRAIAAELSERLREALTRLPERQAEIFSLHALCGLSYREVSQQMQLSEGAVGVAVHRARRRLRELLGDVP
ncbi:MAG TPA: sigma-70 family RNA polymerase sigma factor [Pirellulales bacterium]|nr:sigma-70 family RNA polymerase sigma factor [Pirellulales bacterium]